MRYTVFFNTTEIIIVRIVGGDVMETGRIFSIEEFSTYDGPGIRMTIFLKGCSLRCMWCHNPEGQRFDIDLTRSPNGCLSCGACMRIGEIKTGFPCLVPESVDVCPRRLVRLCGEDYSPEQLVRKIEKNIKNRISEMG